MPVSMVTQGGVQAFAGHPEDGDLPAGWSETSECCLTGSPHPDGGLYGHPLLSTGAY